MSAAALNIGPNLSFEDFRNMAHSKLDQSLDKIKPLFFREEVPTLQEISDVVQKMKQDISGHLLQETTNSLNQTKLAHAFFHCPSCKKPVKKMRNTSRRIETRHGSSLISKPYFYCSSCWLGFSPVDEALELSSRKKQHGLQQLALKFLARLCFNSGASRVIAGLKRMQPASEEAKEQIRKTINYLENNKHRIHYRGDRIGGYLTPRLYSGGVESAINLCHVRLKRSGAWWLKSNGNKMLALRCARLMEPLIRFSPDM